MASGARPSVESAVPATTRKKPTRKGLLAPPDSAVNRVRKMMAPTPSAGRRQRARAAGGTRSMNRTTSSVPSASRVKTAASVSGQAPVRATMTAAPARKSSATTRATWRVLVGAMKVRPLRGAAVRGRSGMPSPWSRRPGMAGSGGVAARSRRVV